MRKISVLVMFIALVVAFSTTSVRADTNVNGDDVHDSYVGSGGLLLSRTWSGDSQSRTQIAHCSGCRWIVQISCHRHEVGCNMGAWPACPPGMSRFDVMFAEDRTVAPTFRGTACIGPHGPVTRRRAQQDVDARVVRGLPELRPQALCPIVIRSLPCSFSAGSPSRLTLAMQILDADVVVSAYANVDWMWSDGRRTASTSAVTRKTFAKPGIFRARVARAWHATFTVDGLGPFPVQQTLHQQAPLTVQVRNIRAIVVE